MTIAVPRWIQEADASDPEVRAKLAAHLSELEDDLRTGGYTKKSYEAGDRRAANYIKNVLRTGVKS